jgi:hypothetical protein
MLEALKRNQSTCWIAGSHIASFQTLLSRLREAGNTYIGGSQLFFFGSVRQAAQAPQPGSTQHKDTHNSFPSLGCLIPAPGSKTGGNEAPSKTCATSSMGDSQLAGSQSAPASCRGMALDQYGSNLPKSGVAGRHLLSWSWSGCTRRGTEREGAWWHH